MGGRGYGKTVFLTKLISLADSSEAGFIQFDAGSEALQLKNLLLENDGRLPATAIKEISRYSFILGKQSGEKWSIQFCDYAGELLERIEANAGDSAMDNVASPRSEGNGGEAYSTEDYTANEGNIPYIRKIKRWLKRCDAVIVLFPVNINDNDGQNKRLYPLSEVNIFRQNVGLLLNIMQKDPVLSNRPVCLAINKWDLLSQGASFDEIVKKEPFVLFNSQLSNICGKNFFCMSISAFGKHLENQPDKADPSGKPFQVSEMLLSLAEKAEHARVISIKDTLKSLPRFIGWPLYPILLLNNLFCGITNPRLQRLNRLLWRKYGIRFAVNSAISACCAFFLICAAMIVSLGFELKSIQHEIQEGFYTSDQIARIEDNLFKPKYFEFVFYRSYWSLMSIDDLERLFRDGKVEYNRNIFDDTEQFFKKRESEITDNELDPQIRKQRIDEVDKRISGARGRLTANSPYGKKLQALADKLAELSRNTQENESFDVAYQKWVNIRDEYEKARQAVAFLRDYTIARYPLRKTHIDFVAQQKTKIETRKYNDLFASLHREIYGDDFGEKTDDYPGRIKRAEARIREIKDARDRLPNSHLLSKYASLIKDEEDRIEYLKKYGHFDIQIEQMLAPEAAKETDIIHRINNFISENRRGYSDRRAASFERLDNRVRALNIQFMREMQDKLLSPVVAADSSANYERQIMLAEKRISIIRDTKGKLSDRELTKACDELIQQAEGIIKERTLYGPFEIALQRVCSTPEEQRIAEINRFTEKYRQSEYPAKAQDYVTLAQHRATLEDHFLAALQKRLPARNPQAKWREQKKIAEQTISIIAVERNKFPENSESWKKCTRKIKYEEDYVHKLEYNGKFDDAHEKLLASPKNDAYIRLIKNFIDSYDAKTYPDRATVIAFLKQEIEQRELALASELTAFSVPKFAKWQEMVIFYQKKIADIEKKVHFFLDESKHIGLVNKFKNDLIAKMKSAEHYGKFDDEYVKLLSDLPTSDIVQRIRLLDVFIQSHMLKDYPERYAQISDCHRQLDADDQKVRQNTLADLKKPQNADNGSLDWETKIARMGIRIEICKKALAQLSAHSQYRQEFAKQVEILQSEIVAIERYKVYYQAYSAVEDKSDLYKVVAIKEFVHKFGNQYPSPLPRYTIERLQKQMAECIVRFENGLKSCLERTADSPNLAWTERLQRGRQRLNALNFFVEATGIEKTDDIKGTERLIVEAERNIAFEKRVYAITHYHGNSSSLFMTIYRFYSDYPAQEWEKIRDKDYAIVREAERKNVAGIMDSLKQEISKYQNTDSLDAAETNLSTQIAKYGEYQKKLYRDIPEYHEIAAKILEARNQLEIIRKAKRDMELIARLIAEGETLAPGKNEAIGAFLTGVSNFVQTVSTTQIHPKIKGRYDELLALRDKWNGELYKTMKSELAPRESALANQNLTDDEKNGLYDQILVIRNKYLALFSPESRQFDLAKREYENSVRSQVRVKKENTIKDGLDELRGALKDSGNGIDVKLAKIKEFETLLGAVGEEKDFPRFREDFDYVRKMKEMLLWDQRLAEIETGIIKLLQERPSPDDEIKVLAFNSSCDEYIHKLVPFAENQRTTSGANELSRQLAVASAHYRAVAQEWFLYKAVKSAQKNFLYDPHDSSYSSFKDAVWSLRQHQFQNFGHDREVQSMEEKLDKINTVRTTLEKNLAEFRSCSSSHSLEQMKRTAQEYLELNMKNNITDYVISLAKWDRRVTVMLENYDFSGSGFESGWGEDVDFNTKIFGFAVPLAPIEFDIPDITGSSKNCPSHQDLEKKLGSTSIRQLVVASIQNSVTIEFMNYNFRNDIGSETVEFARILSKGLDTGECSIVFSSPSRRRPNLGRGSVRIKFSGLPRMQ